MKRKVGCLWFLCVGDGSLPGSDDDDYGINFKFTRKIPTWCYEYIRAREWKCHKAACQEILATQSLIALKYSNRRSTRHQSAQERARPQLIPWSISSQSILLYIHTHSSITNSSNFEPLPNDVLHPLDIIMSHPLRFSAHLTLKLLHSTLIYEQRGAEERGG